jgi:radical SAM protein with 4Fe4S-binding SPASM domain
MEVKVFQRILDQLKSINFTGRVSYDFYNEPLLCSDLDLFVEMTREQLPLSEIHLYTNGSLLSSKRFKELYQLGVSLFIVTKQEQEKVGDYLFEQTFQELNDEEKKRVYFRDHQSLRLTNRGGVLKHIKEEHQDISSMPCFIPTMMLTISLKGNVLACFEDFYQKHSMGNICEETLQEIWNKPQYITLRKKLMMGLRKDFTVCSQCSRVEVLPNKAKTGERPYF